jgi:hypothetical protein
MQILAARNTAKPSTHLNMGLEPTRISPIMRRGPMYFRYTKNDSTLYFERLCTAEERDNM